MVFAFLKLKEITYVILVFQYKCFSGFDRFHSVLLWIVFNCRQLGFH